MNPRHALSGPLHLAEMKREFQLRFLIGQGLIESDTLLDVGCGTLRGGVPIIQYLNRGGYTGIDVRPEVLIEARKEVKEQGLTHKAPRLLNAGRWQAEREYGYVWCFSALIHMSEPVADALFGAIRDHMGVMFANVNIGQGQGDRWQGFPVQVMPIAYYQGLTERHGLRMEVLGQMRDLGHVSGNDAGDSQYMLKFERR